MFARAVIAAVLLVAAGAIVQRRRGARAGRAERRRSASCRSQIDEWRGHDAAPLADDVVATLGVDDYVNRRYERRGAAGLGVHRLLRQPAQRGHDPFAAELPARGGLAAGRRLARRIDLGGGGSRRCTRYEIAKGLDRQVVLYWYQGRGRVVAGEYANKAWLMLDAARYGRSNGGLVRLDHAGRDQHRRGRAREAVVVCVGAAAAPVRVSAMNHSV